MQFIINSRLLDQFVAKCFEPGPKRYRSRRKLRFVRAVEAAIDALEADEQNTASLLRALIDDRDDSKLSQYSLSVKLFPLDRLITTGLKTIELRKTHPPGNKVGKRVFVSESGSKLKFDLSDKARQQSTAFKRDKSAIVGTVVIAGSKYLPWDAVSGEVASAAGLSTEGLEIAWKMGYKYAWELELACNFTQGASKKNLKATRAYGTIWTKQLQMPTKRIPSTTAMVQKATKKSKIA